MNGQSNCGERRVNFTGQVRVVEGARLLILLPQLGTAELGTSLRQQSTTEG